MSDVTKMYESMSDKSNTATKVERGKEGKGKKERCIPFALFKYVQSGLRPHDVCIRRTLTHHEGVYVCPCVGKCCWMAIVCRITFPSGVFLTF